MCAASAVGERGSAGLSPAAVFRPDDPRSQSSIELVTGLGNPGQRYAASRHNIGFRVVDELARRHADADWVRRALSDVTTAPLGPRLVLAKPLTYMNRTGSAVDRLLDLLDIEPTQMLVVVDDIDLSLGSLRLRPSGGPGTHNGLRDVCDRIGGSFPRLRVGVRGDCPIGDLSDYVLSPFTEAEQEHLPEIVARAADAVEMTLLEGLDRAMGRFNQRRNRPDPADRPVSQDNS